MSVKCEEISTETIPQNQMCPQQGSFCYIQGAWESHGHSCCFLWDPHYRERDGGYKPTTALITWFFFELNPCMNARGEQSTKSSCRKRSWKGVCFTPLQHRNSGMRVCMAVREPIQLHQLSRKCEEGEPFDRERGEVAGEGSSMCMNWSCWNCALIRATKGNQFSTGRSESLRPVLLLISEFVKYTWTRVETPKQLFPVLMLPMSLQRSCSISGFISPICKEGSISDSLLVGINKK